jgi:RNA polymerase sigma-70 factor (ECF subfamily)
MQAPAHHTDKSRGAAPLSADAFAEFYAFYLPQLKAFLARTENNAHTLDDLAQETFLRAWNGRDRFLGTSRFRTWLFGIARNTAREARRRRKGDIKPWDEEIVDAAQVTPETDTAADTARLVLDAVSQLSDKQRTAISLVYLSGLTQADAAGKSNCAHDAFRRRLSSGRTNLRKLLGRETARRVRSEKNRIHQSQKAPQCH